MYLTVLDHLMTRKLLKILLKLWKVEDKHSNLDKLFIKVIEIVEQNKFC